MQTARRCFQAMEMTSIHGKYSLYVNSPKHHQYHVISALIQQKCHYAFYSFTSGQNRGLVRRLRFCKCLTCKFFCMNTFPANISDQEMFSEMQSSLYTSESNRQGL